MNEDLAIVYADDAVVVVNKPSGLLSVPGRGPDKLDCVVWRVQQQFPTARIVHRLDCATSGLMVLALSADGHRELSRQFHDREVSKAYIALVDGLVTESEGEVDFPLMTDWPNRPRQMISEEGKHALTRYRTLMHGDNYTRVLLEPVTGRTHQLRVHMMAIGHAILGDRLYATGAALEAKDRLALHAWKLGFQHPVSGEAMRFEPDPPF